MKFVIVLVLLFAVTAYAQEAALPHPFTGKWSTDFGVLNLCTVGNKVYGGFETGYLDAVLGPDRRTLIGTFVYAGNTPDSAPRGARLSVDANNTLIYGFVQSGDSSYSVSYDNIPSDTEPTNFDCRVPSSVKGASIVGAWKTLSDSGEETVINVCYTGGGFTFEATDTNGYYYRGQILAGGLTGAATLYSYQDPTEAFAYGGALFRVIDNGEAHPSLVLTAYSSDIGLVQQNGCNSSPLLSCDQAVFTYSDVESPGVCGSQSSLAAWNGYWTFTATNSELVTRVQGNRVFGNYFFGVFEGVIDPNDPLLVSGIYFSASFQNEGSKNENYFGTFRIQMSPDGKYFSGTIWANFGQINGCNSGGCERDWQETRLPGFATDPSAREVNGISPLLSTNMTTAGVYEFDGHYLDGVNKAYYYRCNIPGKGGDSVEAKGDLTYGSYTENGCGRSTGAERGQVQFSGRSVEPAGTTASENWYDETGYGTQLVRRISDSTMRVNWFFDNPESVFPDLSFCPPELPGSCAGIDSYIFSSTPAQPSDCRFCFAQNPASPASTLTISFFFMAFLALFVAFH